MADNSVLLRQGSVRPIYGAATANTGTLTVQGTPTCSLYPFGEETPVTGFDNIDVTGRDTGAAATRRAWYTLDTSDLEEGAYVLVFTIVAAASGDSIVRTFRPSVLIYVAGPEF